MREFLLLCNRPARGANANTILEHIDAIQKMPGFRVWEISMIGSIPRHVDLNQFDAIGIHYSLHLNDPNNHFLSPRSMKRLADYNGHKCIWMHDEYRLVNDTIKKLNHIGIDTLFTVIPEATAKRIYDRTKLPNTKVVTVLTGYVSPELETISASSTDARPIDISYRARRPPFWLGELGQEKIRIGECFLDEAKTSGLVMDISVEEADRLYDRQWLQLLLRSKAALSSESGASIIDFTGSLEFEVESYVKSNPSTTFKDVQHIIAHHDHINTIHCISPRIFEMAACRTMIVAFPGHYSGIITPWVHYIPIKKDFSNIGDVIKAIFDPKMRQYLTEYTYQDLICSGRYRYETFSLLCANALSISKRPKKSFSNIRFKLALYISPTYVLHNFMANAFQRYVLASSLRAILVRIWLKLPRRAQQMIKPFFRILGR